MKLWAIKAYDALYNGADDVYYNQIIHADSEMEAQIMAWELAQDLVNTYPCIRNKLEKMVQCECKKNNISFGKHSEEEEKIRDKIYDSDATYDVFELDLYKVPTFDVLALHDILLTKGYDYMRQFAKDENI